MKTMSKLPLPTAIQTKSKAPEPINNAQALQSFIDSSKDAQITVPAVPAIPVTSETPSMVFSKNQTKTFPLVLSTEAHQEIAAAARRDGKSIKEFILTAISEKMNRHN